MKIVHIIGYFQPEYGYEESYTALNQVKLGHEVHVITSDRIVNTPKRPLSERYRGRGVYNVDGIIVHRLPVIFPDILNDFVITWGVSKKIKELKPDIIHCHGIRQLGQFQAARLRKRFNYKLVVDHHDFFWDGHYVFPKERTLKKKISRLEYLTFRKILGKYILSRSDKIIGIIDKSTEHLINFFLVNPNKVYTLSLGVETSIFKFDALERKKIREKLKIGDEDFLFIHIGLITKRKNPYLYLDLFKKLGSHYKLLLIGKISDGIDIIDKIKEINNIIYIGEKDHKELNKYISASDAGLYLSNSSVSWYQILACGVPIMGPYNTQLTNLNNYVYYIDTKDNIIEQIYKIVKIIRNGIDRNEIIKYISEKYSYETITKRLLNIYSSTIE